MVGFCFKALNGGIVMVNFYNKYINCAPNEMPKATLSQVAGKPFSFFQVFFFKSFMGHGMKHTWYDGVNVLKFQCERPQVLFHGLFCLSSLG